jgi:hypothetical protein
MAGKTRESIGPDGVRNIMTKKVTELNENKILNQWRTLHVTSLALTN